MPAWDCMADGCVPLQARGSPYRGTPTRGSAGQRCGTDNTVTWLAYWKDPTNAKAYKYVFLGANSQFKSGVRPGQATRRRASSRCGDSKWSTRGPLQVQCMSGAALHPALLRSSLRCMPFLRSC